MPGDVSNTGSDGEVADFNNWLGSIKGKYREMFVISGNHAPRFFEKPSRVHAI